MKYFMIAYSLVIFALVYSGVGYLKIICFMLAVLVGFMGYALIRINKAIKDHE
jgi:hypothetical protein